MFGNTYGIFYGFSGGSDFLYKEIYVIPYEENKPAEKNSMDFSSVFSFAYFPLILLFIIFFILYKVLK